MTQQVEQRRDLSELVDSPQETTEKFWGIVGEIDKSIGSQVVELSREKAAEYSKWIDEVEVAYGGILQLQGDPNWVADRVRTQPNSHRRGIEVPLTDYNEVITYMGSEKVLGRSSKGKRRADASRAYNSMGAFNYAEDHGIYMLPLVHAMIMDSPEPNEVKEAGGFMRWARNELLDIDIYRNNRGDFGRLSSMVEKATTIHHQPGRLNQSSSALVEIAAYFADTEDIGAINGEDDNLTYEEVERLSDNALMLAETFISPDTIGDYPFGAKFNRFIADQIRVRRHTIDFLKIYQDTRFGRLDFDEGETAFRNAQIDFIDDFQDWMRERPDQEGIAFEWMMSLILRDNIYQNGAISEGYLRHSSVREDYPEDGLRGSLSSPKMAHDLVYKLGDEKALYQCKLKSGPKYTDPPLIILKARKALDDTKDSRSFMEIFQDESEKYRLAYQADSAVVSDVSSALESAALSSLQSAA